MIEQQGTGELQAELQYNAGASPARQQWTSFNITERVKDICDTFSPGRESVPIRFEGVQDQLRFAVIEEFRQLGVAVDEEVATAP